MYDLEIALLDYVVMHLHYCFLKQQKQTGLKKKRYAQGNIERRYERPIYSRPLLILRLNRSFVKLLNFFVTRKLRI